jgi:oligogalacturonide lyase
MNARSRVLIAALFAWNGHVCGQNQATQTTTPPTSWVDQDTGHRVLRLTNEPGSRGLYFNFPAFTADGKTMLYLAANGDIFQLDWQTKQSSRLVAGQVNGLVIARTQPQAYFTKAHDPHLYFVNIATGEIRQLGVIPNHGAIMTINANDTQLAGVYMDAGLDEIAGKTKLSADVKPSKKALERARFDAHLPMVLFTLDPDTMTVHSILRTADWLSHVQFSPTDPTLLMYCHEGPWNEVDRIWTVRTDGSANTLIHTRTLEMKNETAGHEFWDSDGKTIWYDLQAPKGQAFFLASYNTATGEQRRYQMNRREWSIHFNGDLQSGLFCGDGSSPFGAASSAEGAWIQLFRPRLTGHTGTSSMGSYKTGEIQSERLVNLSSQDYTDEPNVHFSSDHQFVIFTSNMFGADYVFAVEVAKTPGFKAAASMSHTFSTSDAESSSNIANTTVRVVDASNAPIANAQVSIRSLDTGLAVGQFTTDQDGKTMQIALDKDLHRFTITCPDNRCGKTVNEQFTAPFPTDIVIQAVSRNESSISQPVSAKIALTDKKLNRLSRIQVLVRSPGADKEAWYTTDNKGTANIELPTDPSIVLVFVGWKTYVFKLSSTCNASIAGSGTPCLPISDAIALPIQR